MFKTQPNDLVHDSRNAQVTEGVTKVTGGLTKREYFAIMIMSGFQLGISEVAVELADQLIDELNKKRK